MLRPRTLLATVALLTAVALVLVAVLVQRAGTPAPDPDVPDEAEPAAVVRHVDGDTLHLRSVGGGDLLDPAGESVRLLLIDTPETVKPDSPVECYGPEASDELAELAPVGAEVWVLPDQEMRDQYDRVLLYVWNEDGEFVNAELARAGAGRAVLYEPNDRFIDLVRAAEAEAREAGRGLWGACE